MALQTESGKPVDVEALNQQFHQGLAEEPKEPVATAPAPAKIEKAPETKAPAKKPAAKKPAPKTISPPATPAVTDKRVQAAADILHSFAVVTESFHVATGDAAWHRDTELLASAAPQFGQAMANVAAHNPAFARYLDSEGTGAAMAYMGLAMVSAQIGVGLVDNHNARGKVPLFIKGIQLKLSSIFGKKKTHASPALPKR